MKKVQPKVYRCVCMPANPENWAVVHRTEVFCVVRCSVCKHAWYTKAQYADSLEEKLLSERQWNRLRYSEGFHMREERWAFSDEFDGEPVLVVPDDGWIIGDECFE